MRNNHPAPSNAANVAPCAPAFIRTAAFVGAAVLVVCIARVELGGGLVVVDAAAVTVVVLEPPTTTTPVVEGATSSVDNVEAPATTVEATDCALWIADEAPASAVETTDCADATAEEAPATAVEAAEAAEAIALEAPAAAVETTEAAEALALLIVKMALGLSEIVVWERGMGTMGLIVADPAMVVVMRVGRADAVLRDARTELTEAAMSVFVGMAAAAVEMAEMAEGAAEERGTTTVAALGNVEAIVAATEGVLAGGEAAGVIVMGAIVTGAVGEAEKTE